MNVNALTSLGMRKTLNVRGTVGGVDCDILLDSGASMSVIREDKVPGDLKLKKAGFSFLRVANGSQMTILGKQFGKVRIGNSEAMVELHVTRNMSHDCIIGVDGLYALGAVLDFYKGKVYINSVGTGKPNFRDQLGSKNYGQQVSDLVLKFGDLFDGMKPGAAQGIEHRIKTKAHSPIVSPMSRIPLQCQRALEKDVLEMLEKGVVRKSESPYRFPVVIVKKKDGSNRICIDYRELNNVTIRDQHPLPRIDDLLDRLNGAKKFCTLDLASAYWQVPLAEADREKTAFSVHGLGHFEFNVMPFGLTNAPSTQQAFMQNVFTGLAGVEVLLDDILIYGRNEDEVVQRLEGVFQRLRERNLKLKHSKCTFMCDRVKYLGHIISSDGVSLDPEKVRAIKDQPVPKCLKDLRVFLGMASYCRRFLKDFASISSPLYEALKGSRLDWSGELQKSFERIKDMLCSPPVLASPDLMMDYRLYTDASDVGMGACLTQMQGGLERVIAYGSKKFDERQRRLYAVIEKEAAAIVWAIDHFRSYLTGSKFRVLTDHAPLRWLFSKNDVKGRLARWQCTLIQEEGLEGIDYLRGVQNGVADGLSRNIAVLNFQDFAEKQVADATFSEMRGLSQDETGVWRWKGRCFIPVEFRRRLIEFFHNQGHFGINRTVEVISQQFCWPGCRKEVEEFVKSCSQCIQKCKPVSRPKSMARPLFPFQRLFMDFAGPFQRSRRGNRYFLVIQDDFSKYLKIFPFRECSSENVIEALRTVFVEEGVPKEIVSDNGTHFTARNVARYLNDQGVRHIRSPPYHPQSVGLAERAIKTVKDHLRCMPGDLEFALSEIQKGYNMTIHAITGYAPFEIARGRVVRMDPGFVPAYRGAGKQSSIDWTLVSSREQENERELIDIWPGDHIWVYEKNGKWKNGRLIEMEGTRVARVAVDGEDERRVSRDWIKKREI